MMALLVDGGKVPTRWATLKGTSSSVPFLGKKNRDCVKIALINNMPDPALEDTEVQFFELLESAAGSIPVSVKLFSLPQLPRTERGNKHLADLYHSIDDLWGEHFDALIMTGTEPIQRDLTKEPYWPHLTSVLEGAERNTVSTILSCLAAHAAVLHNDGIVRHPLPDKRFGVFEFPICHHALTRGLGQIVRNPHSRWNEVREEELTASGYQVLTESAEAGVDLFVKRTKKSLFVYFQGHPEYNLGTLLKEYRRDVRRYLRHERQSYPQMPRGYFGAAATGALSDFQQVALEDPREELMTAFPESHITQDLQNGWQSSAVLIYRNWLRHVSVKKGERTSLPVIAGGQIAHHTTPSNPSY